VTVTDRIALQAEATERMEAEAVAKSIQSDNEEWFKRIHPELGSFEAHGMWSGKRRQFKESYNKPVVREALMACDFYVDDEVWDMLTDAQVKKLVKHPNLAGKVKREMNRIDEADGGLIRVPGAWNYGPVKKKPSLDKYEIDE